MRLDIRIPKPGSKPQRSVRVSTTELSFDRENQLKLAYCFTNVNKCQSTGVLQFILLKSFALCIFQEMDYIRQFFLNIYLNVIFQWLLISVQMLCFDLFITQHIYLLTSQYSNNLIRKICVLWQDSNPSSLGESVIRSYEPSTNQYKCVAEVYVINSALRSWYSRKYLHYSLETFS